MSAPGHFCGRLVEINGEPMHGMQHIALALVDDDDRSHQVYMSFGRGSEAQARCRQILDSLEIGRRYHGSATLCRRGEQQTYWLGSVTLALDAPIDRRSACFVVYGRRADKLRHVAIRYWLPGHRPGLFPPSLGRLHRGEACLLLRGVGPPG